MARTLPRRTVESVLREIEKGEQSGGLLGRGKPGMGGLLSGAIPAGTVAAEPSLIEQALQAVQSRPNLGNGASALPISSPPAGMEAKPRGGGLLATGAKPEGSRGLLDPGRGPAGSPPARSPMARTGNFLDDFLFGGAAGDRRAEREGRDRERAAADAHRDAFAFASGPQGFDPNRYGQRMSELGQAPDVSGIVNLEGVNDGRDVRGARHRQEERGVTAGALAGVTRLPEAQRPDALAGVADYLAGQGYNFDPNTNMAGVNARVGAGMGADSYLDNERGERAFAEQQRAAQAGERFRESDLGFRQDESQWERDYREGRAQAEDNQFDRDLEYRREALTAPNSTGDVIAPILAKIATMGEAALNDGERALWANYQRQQQQNPWAGLMGAPPGAPAPTGGAPAPAPAPTSAPAQGVARPQTDTDFNALPVGALYIDPDDGQTYRKGR